ncbi:patatin-like phospholipase family protein [Oceanicella sp. SM1341]|uniref:patatin-like phospholipase family protein n=1 Tax=Oceanicella sp. SM1341 TaxID=1548889 RepID=UPI00130097AC|nr:patatin-like phospholipase family protein [Oceanicella sp. SM1341]
MSLRAGLLGAALALTACSGLPRMPPAIPAPAPEGIASLPGYGQIRYFGDQVPPRTPEMIDTFIARRLAARPNPGRFDILALSGGGSDGAYGAGLLAGWSARGDRPEFDVVTGISTGALIAPFAFLGGQEDDEIGALYTSISLDQIVDLAPLGALFGAPSLGDSAPLRALLEREITPEFVARIAAQYRRGRILLIGTTNLDAQRPVIWDIGAIAASGRDDAPELIREVMLASAAIPAAFPPVLFDVTQDGVEGSELHVDGGVTRSIFVTPPGFDARPIMERLGIPPEGRALWLIRNASLRPDYAPLRTRVLDIAQRSVSTLIKSQTTGDLFAIESRARQDGFAFHLAYVPEDFDGHETEPFDRDYMRALFRRGRADALQGYDWHGSVYPGVAEPGAGN